MNNQNSFENNLSRPRKKIKIRYIIIAIIGVPLIGAALFLLLTNLFLSGVVYPVERMAPFMEILANAIPFTSGISMLQQGIFYGTTLRNLLPQLLQLIVIFIGVLVILGLTNKLSIYMALKEG